MKNQITAIVIALGMGILMSCNSGNKTQPVLNKEPLEYHEVDKPGAGMHKGIIEEAGDTNHIEMVMSGKDVVFYPLDDLTRSLNPTKWAGKATFQYKDGSTKNIDLMIMDDKLTAMGANSGQSFNAIATLTSGGQSISAKFSSEGSIGKGDDDKGK